MVLAVESQLRLDANWIDYLLVAIYFGFVLGIGIMARRSVSSSLDFFLSGRSLPAWVTGLAFISANLGAVEIMGMSANGAQFGIPTVHYFWVGAVPAMLFLGVVMMPFYYGSKVRSVPEFMRRRFGTGAHLVNAISFAIAQLLIAGINLFLLAKIVNILLGWNLYVSLVVAAAIVLSYITLGGLSAAIYNEVLQFFVIVAALVPLTLVGLHKVGGYAGLKEKITAAGDGPAQLSSWPGTNLTGIEDPFWSVIGIVFGLGFVLSFGYWTTNFVEVQRAMASSSMSAAQRSPDHRLVPQDVRAVHRHLPGHDRRGRRLRGGRGEGLGKHELRLQQLDALPDQRPAAQRHARRRHRRPAGVVHGRHGGQRLGLQHGVLLRPLGDLRHQGPQRRLLPAGGPDRDGGGDVDRDRHRVVRAQLPEHHDLPADAVRLLQRTAVRHVHPRHVLERGRDLLHHNSVVGPARCRVPTRSKGGNDP